MNGKWHISKNGVPALCKATKSACPLGQHYENEKQAEVAIQKTMEDKFKLLPINNNHKKLSNSAKKNTIRLIKFITGRNPAGFDYECKTTLALAEELGMKYVSVCGNMGEVATFPLDDKDSSTPNGSMLVDSARIDLRIHYRKNNSTISNPKSLVNVLYYSDNPEDGLLVQSGGSNVLDAALIKKDSIDIIEIKDLKTNAQYPIADVAINRDGSVNIDSLVNNEKIGREAIKNKLEEINFKDADGTNFALNFNNDEDNRKMPLYHLVDSYKSKGATSFIYLDDSEDFVNKIDFSKHPDEVVQDLIDNNVTGTLKMRANISPTLVSKDDLHRFDNLFYEDLFKPGTDRNKKYFTLNEIKEDKIGYSAGKVRVGRYVLPIDHKDYKSNLDQKIIKRQMKSFDFKLTGELKTTKQPQRTKDVS